MKAAEIPGMPALLDRLAAADSDLRKAEELRAAQKRTADEILDAVVDLAKEHGIARPAIMFRPDGSVDIEDGVRWFRGGDYIVVTDRGGEYITVDHRERESSAGTPTPARTHARGY